MPTITRVTQSFRTFARILVFEARAIRSQLLPLREDCFVPNRQQRLTSKLPVHRVRSDEDWRKLHELDFKIFGALFPDSVPEYFYDYKEATEYLSPFIAQNPQSKIIAYWFIQRTGLHEFYINSIGIPKELRGTKVAHHALMAAQEQLLDLAEKSGVTRLSLHVDINDEKLINRYKKLGFQIKKTDTHETNGHKYFYMEANLKIKNRY